MFRCNLPPALLAEWPGSFTCHCGSMGMEQTPNKSQHTTVNSGEENLPPLLPRFELATFWSRVWHSYQQAIPAPNIHLCIKQNQQANILKVVPTMTALQYADKFRKKTTEPKTCSASSHKCTTSLPNIYHVSWKEKKKKKERNSTSYQILLPSVATLDTISHTQLWRSFLQSKEWKSSTTFDGWIPFQPLHSATQQVLNRPKVGDTMSVCSLCRVYMASASQKPSFCQSLMESTDKFQASKVSVMYR